MKKYISLVFLSFAFWACNEDRLEVSPVNQYLSENYFISEEQIFNALIAAYDPMGWSMAFGQWISPVMYGEIRSDNANAGGDPSNNDQPGWQQFDDFTETNTNVVLQPIYRKNYIGIFSANLVILNAKIESPLVNRYQAEAKFLRAYYHFELFRYFGPVPVVTTLLTPDDIDLPRNTMSEMFEAIVADLEEAIDVLPDAVAPSEKGRASKTTAQALLGKAYLYWADLTNDDPVKFDKAAELLQAVVNSNQYQLLDDFSDLFQYGVKNSAESVLEIQHTNLWPSDWSWFEGIEGNGIVQLCGIRGLCSDHPLYTAGWGFMLPTTSLYNHFLSDDTYRRSTAITSPADLAADAAANNVTTCGVIVDPLQSNPFDYTGYFQKKYANFKQYVGNNINGGDPNLTKDANVYVIRYADVLLMLAEAIARGTGSDAAALVYIDQVRERAAGPGDNTGSFKSGQQIMTEQGWSIEDLIWYERRAELAGEGDRWFDLVRSGRASNDLFLNDGEKSNNFNPERIWIPVALEETTVATGLTTYPDPSLFQ